MSVSIRPESPGDVAAIHTLTEAAFRNIAYSDGTEQEVVDRLRAGGNLALSLVAEEEKALVGHIAFSPVTIGDGTPGWYGLGPVSVAPAMQRGGIGSALIERGIANMRGIGAHGIVLLGAPEFYGRFGFRHEPQLTFPGPPAEYFQCLLLQGNLPCGEVRYAAAFGQGGEEG